MPQRTNPRPARVPGGRGPGPVRSPDWDAYPRPSVAVDVAVLTVAPRGPGGTTTDEYFLSVLLYRRDAPDGQGYGQWSLPGSFIAERERLADAVVRTLAQKCSIEGLEPRQLAVLDDPDRDDRGWVLSIAYTDVVPFERIAGQLADNDHLGLARIATAEPHINALVASPRKGSVVEPTGERQAFHDAGDIVVGAGRPSLLFDHDLIVELAVQDLRERYRQSPDPAGLLQEPFTLLELRTVHEAVLGHPLQKDTFRRQMVPGLVDTGELTDGTIGRPAALYRRRPAPWSEGVRAFRSAAARLAATQDP